VDAVGGDEQVRALGGSVGEASFDVVTHVIDGHEPLAVGRVDSAGSGIGSRTQRYGRGA
jgi:hypothetical protein